MSVEVTIQRKVAGLLPPLFKKRKIKQIAVALLQLLNQSDRELSLLFTDDLEIAELNGAYRQKPKSTDVLSFALIDFSKEQSMQELGSAREARPSFNSSAAGSVDVCPLGDIVISLETASVQAERFGVTMEAEILRLLIHGTLHLIGFEHEKVPSHVARKMRLKEAELFANLESILPSKFLLGGLKTGA